MTNECSLSVTKEAAPVACLCQVVVASVVHRVGGGVVVVVTCAGVRITQCRVTRGSGATDRPAPRPRPSRGCAPP